MVVSGKIEDKLRGVLALGVSKPDADCIEIRIRFQQLLTERSKLVVDEINVLFDDSIVGQKALETATAGFREKGDQINLQANLMQNEIVKSVCSKSSFVIR